MAPSGRVLQEPAPRGEGVYRVEDWSEVQRLFHRERLTKRQIARRLGMSRTTVIRLLALPEPPRYARAPQGSLVDPFRDEIAALLATEPTIPATVVLERIRRSGYGGGITVLKEHLARLDGLITRELGAFNEMLKARNVPNVVVRPRGENPTPGNQRAV